jgi:tetratricopeptide (TPR) repeat protein
MNTEQFNIELERIAAEYERAMSQLAFYADKFARINKDDLNELDARALALVEAGKPDEAIKLYEESKILQKFNERVAQRDTAADNVHIISVHLENEIALLEKKNDSVSIERADSIYRLVLHHDSKNYSYNFNYASFLVQSNRFEEAFPYFKQSLLVSRNKEDTDNVLAAINRLYSYIGNPDVIRDYKKQTTETLDILEERKSLHLQDN